MNVVVEEFSFGSDLATEVVDNSNQVQRILKNHRGNGL